MGERHGEQDRDIGVLSSWVGQADSRSGVEEMA